MIVYNTVLRILIPKKIKRILIPNLIIFLLSPLHSNQSKEAFIDWARYDDSQDHFCELDGNKINFYNKIYNFIYFKTLKLKKI